MLSSVWNEPVNMDTGLNQGAPEKRVVLASLSTGKFFEIPDKDMVSFKHKSCQNGCYLSLFVVVMLNLSSRCCSRASSDDFFYYNRLDDAVW